MGHSKIEWSDFPKHEKNRCPDARGRGGLEHDYQYDILGSGGA